jgi:hypothetical protein
MHMLSLRKIHNLLWLIKKRLKTININQLIMQIRRHTLMELFMVRRIPIMEMSRPIRSISVRPLSLRIRRK